MCARRTIHTALSLLHQRNAGLDEYLELLDKGKSYGIESVWPEGRHLYPVRSRAQCAAARYYNYYPVAVAAPPVFALDRSSPPTEA